MFDPLILTIGTLGWISGAGLSVPTPDAEAIVFDANPSELAVTLSAGESTTLTFVYQINNNLGNGDFFVFLQDDANCPMQVMSPIWTSFATVQGILAANGSFYSSATVPIDASSLPTGVYRTNICMVVTDGDATNTGNPEAHRAVPIVMTISSSSAFPGNGELVSVIPASVLANLSSGDQTTTTIKFTIVDSGFASILYSVFVDDSDSCAGQYVAHNWIPFTYTEGSVTAGATQTQTIDIPLDATGLSDESYRTNICIMWTDATGNHVQPIPVTLDITQSEEIFADGFE